jgi:hypothetical protein
LLKKAPNNFNKRLRASIVEKTWNIFNKLRGGSIVFGRFFR